MDRARGTGAATRGGPGAGTAARGGPAWGARVEAYGIARVRGRAVPLAAPFPSPRRSARRAAPLVTVALLHVPLVGMALLHAQGPRSAQ